MDVITGVPLANASKIGNPKPEQLTNDAAVDIDPAFSPDGKKLAFVSDREGKSMALWVRDFQTGTDTKLTALDKDRKSVV